MKAYRRHGVRGFLGQEISPLRLEEKFSKWCTGMAKSMNLEANYLDINLSLVSSLYDLGVLPESE